MADLQRRSTWRSVRALGAIVHCRPASGLDDHANTVTPVDVRQAVTRTIRNAMVFVSLNNATSRSLPNTCAMPTTKLGTGSRTQTSLSDTTQDGGTDRASGNDAYRRPARQSNASNAAKRSLVAS